MNAPNQEIKKLALRKTLWLIKVQTDRQTLWIRVVIKRDLIGFNGPLKRWPAKKVVSKPFSKQTDRH